jgi:hypothetical protein
MACQVRSKAATSRLRPVGVGVCQEPRWQATGGGAAAYVATKRLFGLILLLDRVVDGLSDDLAILDQVGIGAIGDPNVGVFVRPFQERHISFGGLVGVLIG